ncbi:MAG: CRISPR system precrRNA processing endoribonuclease RAMP protein Cas6 [Bacillota bacterium]|nr:CRISPR system precrRNA processing endoribonuclease RAMP protein Cas6 [Bacillota bacterium]
MKLVPCPQGLALARYEIRFRAGVDGVLLPPYKGSTFRGGFAGTFRHLVCARDARECKECSLKHNCPYPLVFESEPPPGSEALRSFDAIPRPFVLEPPPDRTTFYNPGETFDFALILFGKARNLLPYFVVTLEEFSRRGIGKERRPFSLEEIAAINPLTGVSAIVYHGEDRVVRPRDLSLSAGDIWNRAAGYPVENLRKIEAAFHTPTRITHEDTSIRSPEFHAVVRNLLRRISSLCYFHHGFAYEADFLGIIRRAGEVRLVRDDTSWVTIGRYSSRQARRVPLEGFVGRAVYEGPLGDFLPLLLLGELIHVGKGTVFGQGRFELRIFVD